MINLSDLDAIIFDLGGVILNLDFELTIIEFNKLIPHFDRRTFLGQKEQLPFFNAYEVGELSTEDFIVSFNNHYKSNFSLENFKKCWNAMILNIPKERIILLNQLRSQGKKIYLLSNINHLHELAVDEKFKELNKNHPFLSIFDKGYYSHHIGLRKPSPDVFNLVIREQKLDVKRTLFIDDTLHHVEGARSVGLQSLHLSQGLTIEKVFSTLS
jgi:putative hydrolase of the HAD superfamily